MKEFRIKWCQCPHIQHDTKVLFIEAATDKDAKAIAKDHIERRYGIDWFTIMDVSEAQPVPAGRVIER